VRQGVITVEASRSQSNRHTSRSQSDSPQGLKETHLKVTKRHASRSQRDNLKATKRNIKVTIRHTSESQSNGYDSRPQPNRHASRSNQTDTLQGHNQTHLKVTKRQASKLQRDKPQGHNQINTSRSESDSPQGDKETSLKVTVKETRLKATIKETNHTWICRI